MYDDDDDDEWKRRCSGANCQNLTQLCSAMGSLRVVYTCLHVDRNCKLNSVLAGWRYSLVHAMQTGELDKLLICHDVMYDR